MNTELLTLGRSGSLLRVSVEPGETPLPERTTDPWFRVNFEVDAHPFSGTFDDALQLDDLREWRRQLTSFVPPARLQLGGSRAATLQLHIDEQVGGTPGRWSVEVRLTRSEDDPWPEIRFLIFEVEPFTTDALRIVTTLLG